jgi:hypothetical protein
MKFFIFTISLCACLSLISCGDDSETTTGKMEIEFDNVAGEQDLVLNTTDEPYTNAAGESYRVTTLRYYISNIKLKRSDGTVYEDPLASDGSTGYYLIDESDAASQTISLQNIPEGDYTEVTFTIGVDAAKVAEGAQTGPLDPGAGMFWSWDSGYIFVKLEGTSSYSSDPDHYILYHVGGYKDPNNNIKIKTCGMGSEPARVRGDHTPKVHIIADIQAFFAAPNEISFAGSPVRHSPASNKVVAENYMSTFEVDHVHN